MLLAVPRSRLKHKGDQAFAVAAPKLWNSLPPNIRASPTLDTFKTCLKKHVIHWLYNQVLIFVFILCALLIVCAFFTLLF